MRSVHSEFLLRFTPSNLRKDQIRFRPDGLYWDCGLECGELHPLVVRWVQGKWIL